MLSVAQLTQAQQMVNELAALHRLIAISRNVKLVKVVLDSTYLDEQACKAVQPELFNNLTERADILRAELKRLGVEPPSSDYPVGEPPSMIKVSKDDLQAWRDEWMACNPVGDGEDHVTPFDHYLY